MHDSRYRGCTGCASGLQVCTLRINDFPPDPRHPGIFSSPMQTQLICDTMEQRVQDMMRLMSSKIRSIAETLSDDEISRFLEEMLRANRIYVMGAGRSGLVAKAFAMRLMHLGFLVRGRGDYHPGDKSGDLMIVFSGSGSKNGRRYRRDSKGDRGAYLPDHIECRFPRRENIRRDRDHRAPAGRCCG